MFRDQHVTLIVNKETTFSYLQSAINQGRTDTVKFYCPAETRDMHTTAVFIVQTTNHIAASALYRVRNLEIYQSNNEADVILNLSVKCKQTEIRELLLPEQNYEVPQVFNMP